MWDIVEGQRENCCLWKGAAAVLEGWAGCDLQGNKWKTNSLTDSPKGLSFRYLVIFLPPTVKSLSNERGITARIALSFYSRNRSSPHANFGPDFFFFFKCPWTMSLGIFTWIKCSHYSFLLALPGISLLQRTGTLTYVPVSFSSAQLSADGVLQVRGGGQSPHWGPPTPHGHRVTAPCCRSWLTCASGWAAKKCRGHVTLQHGTNMQTSKCSTLISDRVRSVLDVPLQIFRGSLKRGTAVSSWELRSGCHEERAALRSKWM